jgi:hypothetical protein
MLRVNLITQTQGRPFARRPSQIPRFSIIFPGIREILKSVVKFVRSSIPEPAPVRLAKW